MKLTTAFYKIGALRHYMKVIQGSKGAGKTFSILMRWILMASTSKEAQLVSIVTSTFPLLRTGAIKDFESICSSNQIAVSKTKTPCVFKVGLWTFEFFSVDDELKGLGGRRDRLLINEAPRVKWKIARQLIGRTHKEVILDFNPISRFWAHEQYVDTGECAFVKLTYKDNEELPVKEVESIERHSPTGSMPDANFWRVYGEGEIGFVEGQILFFNTFNGHPEGILQEAIGIDWGGVDPQASIKVWVDHDEKKVYWKELFYASGDDLEDEMFDTVLSHPEYNKDLCACDHDPRAISRARKKGLSAMNAIKPQLKKRINMIKQYKLFIHKDSLNLIREANEWKYQEKTIDTVPYPDQSCDDHAIDAAFYGTCFIIRN